MRIIRLPGQRLGFIQSQPENISMRIQGFMKIVHDHVFCLLDFRQQNLARLQATIGNSLFCVVLISVCCIHNLFNLIVVCLVKYVVKKILQAAIRPSSFTPSMANIPLAVSLNKSMSFWMRA
jgi:hypothetical protein